MHATSRDYLSVKLYGDKQGAGDTQSKPADPKEKCSDSLERRATESEHSHRMIETVPEYVDRLRECACLDHICARWFRVEIQGELEWLQDNEQRITIQRRQKGGCSEGS